jgi:uncharacterized glyoxalase superfamily protein PhnB
MPAKALSVAPVILVRDIHASVAYWRDKVGFETDQIYGDPPGFAMPKRDSVVVMIAQAPKGAELPPPNWRVLDKSNQAYVWVDDARALYQELQDRGATIDYTLYDTPWGTREFGIQDLDDHDITFGQVLG